MKLFIHPLAARQLYPATYPEPCVGSMIREETGEEDAEATRLLELVRAAIVATEFPANGQGFLPLPDEAKGLIMSGAAQVPGELCPKGTDFVVRVHRGEPVLVLERNQLSDEALRPAFEADPETTADECAAMEAAGATHALITVLATKGPKPPISSHRFVRNLAGGNTQFILELQEAPEMTDLDARATIVARDAHVASFNEDAEVEGADIRAYPVGSDQVAIRDAQGVTVSEHVIYMDPEEENVRVFDVLTKRRLVEMAIETSTYEDEWMTVG